ncbi:peptidoglycan recognition protein family protein [Streptomonospora litoralis]|uniref:N-acetylmuramoyl-L-alanine amidase n=1 Tax=Streptomonospora litoralis TaxID=2498135 RepID=A0A4P6Q7G3_9ACTN|nr:peptidoglycan recognition family protein [Streptomonospora litoralis]QBI56736.1 N-acetylmuramoyl-L-alanine amidase [Streptomonospora litoralis]
MSTATRGTLAAGDRGRAAGAVGFDYVRRAGWAADERLRFDPAGTERWPRDHHPVQTVTVHHTALAVAPDPAESMRSVYRLHAVENGWGDIGYHLVIDPAGTVYEGRFAGGEPSAFGITPGPEGARCVTAGHVGGHNAGNIGVCLLGDFTESGPSDPARKRLVEVLRTLCSLAGVDPRETVAYANPVTGATARVRGVAMHRDWPGDTSCPGEAFAAGFEPLRDSL